MLLAPHRRAWLVLCATAVLAASPALAQAAKKGKAPTVAEAQAFLEKAEATLLELSNRQQRAGWVAANFITDDTEGISADGYRDLIAANMALAKESVRFDGMTLPEDLARRMKLLKLAVIPLPAPSDPKLQKELTTLTTSMEGIYGKGKYCKGADGKDCLDINAIGRIMAESRDYDQLLDVWKGWHQIAVPIKPRYVRFVELGNQGAKELGYPDLGAFWRSNYDMPPDQFAAEMDRLYEQLRPFYESLHAYVRTRLAATYGTDKVPEEGPIPAHLLGNVWAQDWSNIYPLVAPPNTDPGFDLDAILKARNTSAVQMAKYGEGFFTSLGFDPLPASFWERSLFVKPRDRDVVCHASAWDVDNDQDLRIKMCIEPTAEDFSTIHHEEGHNFYQRAYRTLPFLYRDSANDGFHEAIGDTVALSVTPDYLVKVGLLDKVPAGGNDLGFLMKRALEKVAFLPFGLLVDKWRWQVFSGQVKPEQYNQAWWDLRKRYQGVAPAGPRGEDLFDPGAKYHVPGNTPYARYFLADVLQFQFHRALCREAGFQGPLYQCSIYANGPAGERLRKTLAMGKSKPWPVELEALTGEKQMDASAILEYFAPLKQWLDEQNRNKKVGW